MPPQQRRLVIALASAISALAIIASLIGVFVVHSSASAGVGGITQFQPLHGKISYRGRATLHGRMSAQAGLRPATRASTVKKTYHQVRELHLGKGPLTTNAAAPSVTSPSSGLTPANGAHIPSFNALSALDDDKTGSGEWSPPDQGLCVGYDPTIAGRPEVIFELVNQTIGEYLTDGTPVTNGVINAISLNAGGPGGFDTSLTVFFKDTNAYGDPRCIYDLGTQSLFFTELNAPILTGSANTSGVDLLQLNTSTGATSEYYIDFTDASNSGCPCLGDQPRVGFDASAIYITADQFPEFGPGVYSDYYNGSELMAISKQDVVNGSTSPAEWYFHNLHLSGIPVLGLVPADTWTSFGSEWMANTVPYNAQGADQASNNVIGIWHSNGDANLEHTPPTLSVKSVHMETYAFPVEATTPSGGVPALNPDDDRVTALEYLNGHLYTAFETALKIGKSTYDGIAWVDIVGSTYAVNKQGYVDVSGENLIYPSLWRNAAGAADLNYTITSPSLDPSAAASYRTSDSAAFSSPHIAGVGASPYQDQIDDRFGDYSCAAPDPGGSYIWMANEYVPPQADQGYYTNWGTWILRH